MAYGYPNDLGLRRYKQAVEEDAIQLPIADDFDGVTCEVSEDTRCEKPATHIVYEPYTPGRFDIECCEEHAKDLIHQGYEDGGAL